MACLIWAPGPASAAVSTAICVNQVGFLPNNVKGFSVVGSLSGPFQVCLSPTGSVAYTGTFAAPVVNADTEQTLTLGDFSSLTTPGTYYISVAGTGQSPAFSIASTVYNNPFWVEMMGYYIRRCGNIAPSFTWNGLTYSHTACHTGDADAYYVDGDANTTQTGTEGWHDAGDYGKYTVNMAFAVTQLLQAWDWHQGVLGQWTLPIPENGGAYPDYLAEVKWALDWMLEMQAADGGAYHKMTGLDFEPFGILPQNDTTQRYYTPESSAATAEFCAVMSMAGRLYAPYGGGTYAAQCLSSAAKAYAWLQANPAEVLSNANATCASAGLGFATGDYEDPPCAYPAGSGLDDDPDHRVHADAEYWDATGDTTALTDFETRELPANDPDQVSLYWDWGEHLYGKRGPKNNGIFSYLLSGRAGRSPAIVSNLESALFTQAAAITTTCAEHGYARPLGDLYHWGSNGTTARQSMLLDCANRLSPNNAYMNAALGALGYLYGRNYYSRSFVTGVGASPPLNPHDELSAAMSAAAGDTVTVPGHLVGGPGGHNETATDWTDTQADYYTNEIAINWDGGLVAALACFITTPVQTPSPTPSPCAACSATASPTRTAQETATPSPTASPSPGASPTATATPSATQPPCGDAVVLRVDCGSVTDYTDSQGDVWATDNGFLGGTTASTTAAIAGTSDPLLYQANRYASPLVYEFNLPNGSYQVVLLNSENAFAAAGKRVFSIALQGVTVESGYDIYAAAGAEYKATSLTFTTTVSAGLLDISATASVNEAQFAAIEVTWLGPACASDTPTPTTSPSFSASPTRSASPSATASPTSTPTATRTASPSATASFTPTASPSSTPSASATASPTSSPSATATVSSSATAGSTPSTSPTRTLTPSVGPSGTPSGSYSATESPTVVSTWTPSPSASASPSAAATPAGSPTASPGATPTESQTPSPTRSGTASATPTASPSVPPSPTESASSTETSLPSPSQTASSSPTPSAAATLSPSPSRTQSPSPTGSETAGPNGGATPSATAGWTATAGFTRTPTPDPDSDALSGAPTVLSAGFAPNPVPGSQATLAVLLAGDADSLELKLYSCALTRVADFKWPGPAPAGWSSKRLELPNLPNGLYYALVQSKQGDRLYDLKRPVKLMLLR